MECGEVTGSGSDGTDVTATVTFDTPFTNPVVFFRGKETSSSSYSSYMSPFIHAGIESDANITSTGFTVKYGQAYTGGTRNFTVQWVAMEDSLIQ